MITRKTDMTGIPRPQKVHFDEENDCSILFFPDGTSSRWHLRGGVCWPIVTHTITGQSSGGYILMAGQNLDTKEIFVFEEKAFFVIEPIIDRESLMITHDGITNWLNTNWSRYMADGYYYHADEITHKKYALQVIRSNHIEPTPAFIEVDWRSDEQARRTVWEMMSLRRLFFRDGELAHQMQSVNTQPDRMFPAVEALTACINGFVNFPYRGGYAG